MPASRILTAAFASAILLGGAGSAFAWDSDNNYAYLDWVNSKVTTADAARIAEEATGGTTAYLTFDHYDSSGLNVYRVDTRSADEVATVEIDANTGAVRNVSRVAAADADSSSGDLAEVPQPGPSDNPS